MDVSGRRVNANMTLEEIRAAAAELGVKGDVGGKGGRTKGKLIARVNRAHTRMQKILAGEEPDFSEDEANQRSSEDSGSDSPGESAFQTPSKSPGSKKEPTSAYKV